MPSIPDIITSVIAREGGSQATNIPGDAGGRTQYGISERANPQAWLDGKVTEAEAREIYLQKYVVFPKFNLIPPSHAKLQAQLIDYGVNSGPQLAITKLQAILGVEADGNLGPDTLRALMEADAKELNNKLVAARARMIGSVVAKNPTQVKFLLGLLDRALSFLY